MTLSYLNMLIVMTYNPGLMMAIVTGAYAPVAATGGSRWLAVGSGRCDAAVVARSQARTTAGCLASPPLSQASCWRCWRWSALARVATGRATTRRATECATRSGPLCP
jgi:hypothetical protein